MRIRSFDPKDDLINHRQVAPPIKNIYEAVDHFKKAFETENGDNPRYRKFEVVDRIMGDHTMDYTKSYSKTINRSENAGEDTLKKERERTDVYRVERQDIKKFVQCWVIRVTYLSGLGIRDHRYYYVVRRERFFNRWANTLYERAKKHFDKDGITLKTDIIIHSLKNPLTMTDTSEISTLVLVMGNSDIYYMNLDKINRLAAKGLGVVTDKWNQQVVGIPKDEFSLKDVNIY